jgi:hypothetical protein
LVLRLAFWLCWRRHHLDILEENIFHTLIPWPSFLKFIGVIAKRFPNPAIISTIDYDDEGYIDVGALSGSIAAITDSSINEYYHGFADIIYDLVVVLPCIPLLQNN